MYGTVVIPAPEPWFLYLVWLLDHILIRALLIVSGYRTIKWRLVRTKLQIFFDFEELDVFCGPENSHVTRKLRNLFASKGTERVT
jgi:hypothetical protein